MVSAAAVVTEGAAPLGALIAGYALTVAGPATTAWIIFTVMAVLAVSYARFLRPLANTAKPPREAASDFYFQMSQRFFWTMGRLAQILPSPQVCPA
ncbi:hypothetical protein Ato02nite_079620 [Paractinoplanes toevensis]|uniref:Uncharacterized protein n=1 Tax=Paractinoplanes toevensis TaxID=571911 RepID=A0A919W9N1_9ACTN|nr:hypothetical protein Ato02nite_079620 [Actinoplanes toevensis]